MTTLIVQYALDSVPAVAREGFDSLIEQRIGSKKEGVGINFADKKREVFFSFKELRKAKAAHNTLTKLARKHRISKKEFAVQVFNG